jgi:hypothetical protein
MNMLIPVKQVGGTPEMALATDFINVFSEIRGDPFALPIPITRWFWTGGTSGLLPASRPGFSVRLPRFRLLARALARGPDSLPQGLVSDFLRSVTHLRGGGIGIQIGIQ